MSNIPNEFEAFRTEFLRTLAAFMRQEQRIVGGIIQTTAECERLGAMTDAAPAWVERIFADMEAGN